MKPNWNNELLLQFFLKTLTQFGIESKFRVGFDRLWNSTAQQLPYLPVDYSNFMIDYQAEYCTGNGRELFDFSIILQLDGKPCGIWPITIEILPNNDLSIGSNGAALLPPLFIAGTPGTSIRNETVKCISFIREIAIQLNVAKVQSNESFTDQIGLSEWQERILHAGGLSELRHELYIDTSLPMKDIKYCFRKSYKALISSGLKHWVVKVHCSLDEETWQKFRELHRSAAGRYTRSARSWEIQREAVNAREAFFVSLSDADQRLIGGGLFQFTKDEGFYSIAAYDRSYFDKPVGHVVIFKSIEEMIQRKVRWYKLGPRVYSSNSPPPSPKEQSISDFKKGFSSHTFPKYKLEMIF